MMMHGGPCTVVTAVSLHDEDKLVTAGSLPGSNGHHETDKETELALLEATEATASGNQEKGEDQLHELFRDVKG